jgi:hypothetical protein
MDKETGGGQENIMTILTFDAEKNGINGAIYAEEEK